MMAILIFHPAKAALGEWSEQICLKMCIFLCAEEVNSEDLNLIFVIASKGSDYGWPGRTVNAFADHYIALLIE